jgi:hypothetical protein
MPRTIHVHFTRPVDSRSALGSLEAHGLNARLRRRRSEIEIGCRPGDEGKVMSEVSHVLDDWLVERGLPFMPVRTGTTSLVVRPPAD